MPEWRDVSKYEGVYQVSDDGQVRSLPRVVMRKNGVPQTVRGRILKPGKTQDGYLVVALMRNGAQEMAYVHHLVLEAFVGPRPDGLECCHKNGVPYDCQLPNLRWGTASDNEHDKVTHGRSNRGDQRSGAAKVTPSATREIRKAYATGIPLHELGAQYGIAKETVYAIVTGRSWSHMGGPTRPVRTKSVNRRPWTSEEEALILTMSPEESAGKLGRTVSSVKMKLWRIRT